MLSLPLESRAVSGRQHTPSSSWLDDWLRGYVVKDKGSRSSVWLFWVCVVCAWGLALLGVLRGWVRCLPRHFYSWEFCVCFQVGDVSRTRVVIVPGVCATSDLILRSASCLHPCPPRASLEHALSPASSLGQDFNIYHRLVG